MHTPSLIHILATGLAASTAVAGLEVTGTAALARRVGAVVALAGPVLALPTEPLGLEAREPHQ
jgi:hypothetical protein